MEAMSASADCSIPVESNALTTSSSNLLFDRTTRSAPKSSLAFWSISVCIVLFNESSDTTAAIPATNDATNSDSREKLCRASLHAMIQTHRSRNIDFVLLFNLIIYSIMVVSQSFVYNDPY